ncbi:helix-turn-helix domain-containing protein [Actinomadura violacea]|uniref:Helix-turn-helix domain-containing protein n=1 Tax=Actinomadura violacea TaxID=2819934 RepID=A0ABS3RN65_9ACTN|nr:helix-turn-helix domain-containing protein [Actinomadura violacea]MBO2457998.1 helix-turn-helix domain-containing protein [Actinomadura violacea]
MEMRSSDLPPGERLDWWRDLTARDLVPTRIAADPEADFHAAANRLEMGAVQASILRFSALRSTRTRRLIRHSDPEWWVVALVRTGFLRLEQDRNEAGLHAGDLVLYDTSHPFEAEACRSEAGVVMLHLPRHALPLPDRKLRGLVARPLPSRSGAGDLLAGFLAGCAEQASALDGGAAPHLGSAASGLATAFLAGLADADDAVPAPTRQEALVLRIKAFVLAHLHEPDLSPSTVAAAHHISVRYLHHLFHEDGQSLGAFVRTRRLERCRTDLADPRLARTTVAEIGARWGFPDASSFNRAFKAAYGTPPGDHRP